MTLAQTLPIPSHSANRLSFALKAVLAGGLAVLADLVFDSGAIFLEAGSVAGLLALLWLAALVTCNRQMRSHRESCLAIAGAVLAAFALLYEPGIVAALLFLAYLGLGVFLPRHGSFDNALRWLGRLLLYAIANPLSILFDIVSLGKTRRGRGLGLSKFLGALSLTLVGSLIFLGLFSQANPLILEVMSNSAASLDSPGIAGYLAGHLLFSLCALIPMWASLRPLAFRALAASKAPTGPKAGFGMRWEAASVIPALAVFNLIFALQNLSDLAFLWSGARLPQGVTFSDYAHRGINSLIVAALVAAVFVLGLLRTGSPLSAHRIVRVLVLGWIGQTVLLMLSTMERTLNYIEAYSLTYTRLNALIFMALVACGLVLICWRIAKGRSGAWLINANASCVAVVLTVVSFTNYDAAIARWNLAIGAGDTGRPVRLDIGYLSWLDGSGALPALAEATRDPAQGHGDLLPLRRVVQGRLEREQADWRRWTLAGAWRLAAAGPLPIEAQPDEPNAPKSVPAPGR